MWLKTPPKIENAGYAYLVASFHNFFTNFFSSLEVKHNGLYLYILFIHFILFALMQFDKAVEKQWVILDEIH